MLELEPHTTKQKQKVSNERNKNSTERAFEQMNLNAGLFYYQKNTNKRKKIVCKTCLNRNMIAIIININI